MLNLIPLIMSMFISVPPVKPVPPCFSPVSVTQEFRKVSKAPRSEASEGRLFDAADGNKKGADENQSDKSFYGGGINDFESSKDNRDAETIIERDGNRSDYANGSDVENDRDGSQNDSNVENDFSDYKTRKEELDNRYSRRAELREKIIVALADVIDYYEEYNELTHSYTMELRGILRDNVENNGNIRQPEPKPMPDPIPLPTPDDKLARPNEENNGNSLSNGGTDNYVVYENLSSD